MVGQRVNVQCRALAAVLNKLEIAAPVDHYSLRDTNSSHPSVPGGTAMRAALQRTGRGEQRVLAER